MKHKFLSIFLICILLVQLPCHAFWWKKKKPVLDVGEKMQFVNVDWWDNFSDPYLKYYVLKALECNHDLKATSWQVDQFRQMVRIQFSQELPTISTGASYVGLHIDNTPIVPRQNIFSVPFIASYEPDLLLKNRDKTRSSERQYEAARFQEQSTYISMIAAVGTVYLNVIKFDKEINLQTCLVQVKKEELIRENERYQNGTSTAQNVNNARKDYQSAKSNLDTLTKSRDIALTQLAIMIGESAENACSLKRNSFDCLEYMKQIPCEVSADVIFSRPDVYAAEKLLEKAGIDVRIARKEFLPRFNVTAIYAFTNLDGNFFNWNSAFAAVLASVTQDIFTGGRKVANLKLYKERYEELFENYKETDLRALKDVRDSLLIIYQDTKVDKNTITNLQLEEDNHARYCKSYKQGIIPYTDLLKEREQLITNQRNQTESKAARLTDYITLYKAVGGGKGLN